MNLDQVKVLVANGLSIYCATCTRYWEGRDRKLENGRCTAVNPCGSPLAKMAFPEYAGPITQHSMYCFVCGAESKYGVSVKTSQMFGVCADHIEWLRDMAPVGGKPAVDADVITPDGRLVTAGALLKKPRTLMQAIAETEAELAKDRGE